MSITVPAERTTALADRLQRLDGVLSVRVHNAASVSPPGDVVEADVLDRSLAATMRIADEFGLGDDDGVSLTSTAPASVVSAGNMSAIMRDSSTASWEEVELTLGRESTMTFEKVLVMGFAGVVAAVGVMTGALHIVIGAMVIVPGFEPLVRIALGLVHRQRSWRDGLVDVARGYGALLLGAAAGGAVLAATGTPLPAGGRSYHEGAALLAYWTSTTAASVMVSAAAGLAGALLLVIRRQVLTAGVMIALALVPALTVMATGTLARDWPSVRGAAVRWLVDVVLVIATSAVVLAMKRRVEQRAPTSDAQRA